MTDISQVYVKIGLTKLSPVWLIATHILSRLPGVGGEWQQLHTASVWSKVMTRQRLWLWLPWGGRREEGGNPRPRGDIIHSRANHPHLPPSSQHQQHWPLSHLLGDHNIYTRQHYTLHTPIYLYLSHYTLVIRDFLDKLLTYNFPVWSTQIIIRKVFSSFPENNLFFFSGIFNGQYRGFTITVWRSNNISS